MQVFPEEMRGDIALHINREMLSLSIFKAASIGCQKSIAQLIWTRFATPGEFLVHRGDAIRNLYFVCSGSLEILDEDGSVVALLGEFRAFWPFISSNSLSSRLECLPINCVLDATYNLKLASLHLFFFGFNVPLYLTIRLRGQGVRNSN